MIFSSGSGVAPVDEEWFAHAVPERVFGLPVRLCPPEEIIWQKAFIMERERYDGADVLHMLRACRDWLDWERLIRRFGDDWRVLLSHLTLFGFVYPDERDVIPDRVVRELTTRLRREQSCDPPDERVCRGTLLSRAQYLVDVEREGYEDARLATGNMTADDIAHWTEAIDGEHKGQAEHESERNPDIVAAGSGR